MTADKAPYVNAPTAESVRHRHNADEPHRHPAGGEPHAHGLRPRLLDLYCGAGGAAMGYWRAGFDVVGVDIKEQPDYPFEFHQGDALDFPLDGFDVIHGSPPCHDHTSLSPIDDGSGWLLAATVSRMLESGKTWVCENVVGRNVKMAGWWFVLCGSMFGMQVRRHRRFGSSHLLMPPRCDHDGQGRPWTITGNGGPCDTTHSLKPSVLDFWRYMDMPWMEGRPHYGVAQAIPPAYTEWIGSQLLDARWRRHSDGEVGG